MSDATSLTEEVVRRLPGQSWPARATHKAMIVLAIVFGPLTAPAVKASESMSVAVSATVVSVCRFLTSASSVGAKDYGSGGVGSATLTYACSSGAAAAFTFAVPAPAHVACTTCSGIPVSNGEVLATSIGTGQGLGAGHDRTLSVAAPLHRADNDDGTSPYLSTIVVTVSP